MAPSRISCFDINEPVKCVHVTSNMMISTRHEVFDFKFMTLARGWRHHMKHAFKYVSTIRSRKFHAHFSSVYVQLLIRQDLVFEKNSTKQLHVFHASYFMFLQPSNCILKTSLRDRKFRHSRNNSKVSQRN